MCTVWPSHSNWLSEQSNESTSNFSLSLNILPQKLLGWFRRLQLRATGGSLILTTQVTQPHYSPDLVSCDFWVFPKLKSSLKGKRCLTINEMQGNMMGQLMVTERNVWSPKVPTLKGTEGSLSYVQCFLYLVSSSINVSIFIVHGWIPSGQTLYVSRNANSVYYILLCNKAILRNVPCP